MNFPTFGGKYSKKKEKSGFWAKSHGNLGVIPDLSRDVFTPELGNTLHQLFLDYNFITKLDEGVFDNLTGLRKLVLDGNRGLKISKKAIEKLCKFL